ncbi:aldehyde dehydrogenase family protein [Pollutimonas bauzanensis]|uniref:L-glutamate gamma-semialdehyde dehydrogenase n=1 Tax=Pollutimonas bauzanensis TaxID=658167 RepID=A0A1M5VIR3_9BURK|nr:aldehyde dehydrogenase family protein [Pollutimonas bauzanensis]SHH75121.1 1-pyrroline-5-carboxylate dehydrogenase [Pollutimonas bauzanensis]
MSGFKLTYSTMFSPPRELHTRFAKAVDSLAEEFGKRHGLFINGGDVHKEAVTAKSDPADQDRTLGEFSLADETDVDTAVMAARRAYPAWRGTPWQQRVAILKKVAGLVEERLYDIAAAVSFEVGKNRMEALGEVAEVVEFCNLYARQMEENNGYDRVLPDDPLPDFKSHNRSVLKPYGVWAVVAPFNYPFALAGGPVAAALVAGNTVVLKGAVETPWSGQLLAQCIKDAGVPDGVFNYLVGEGATVGDALIRHDGIDGVTFTGSYEVGMHIGRSQWARAFPRPCIAEMGGKNAVIVTAAADLAVAAQGIVRSAFGMSGQKCSALSRIYVDARVADGLIGQLRIAMRNIKIGDPRQEDTWMGPVATAKAYGNFEKYCAALRTQGASILEGGATLRAAGLERGFFCAPTLAEAPLEHPLWAEEMFVPVVMLGRVESPGQAMALANGSKFGLTAGFYGSDAEVEWFFANIEAGVTYANRPQGATTGAWPGYQPFGGWKGSGSTGKALASFHYLPQYMREQSQTHIEP